LTPGRAQTRSPIKKTPKNTKKTPNRQTPRRSQPKESHQCGTPAPRNVAAVSTPQTWSVVSTPKAKVGHLPLYTPEPQSDSGQKKKTPQDTIKSRENSVVKTPKERAVFGDASSRVNSSKAAPKFSQASECKSAVPTQHVGQKLNMRFSGKAKRVVLAALETKPPPAPKMETSRPASEIKIAQKCLNFPETTPHPDTPAATSAGLSAQQTHATEAPRTTNKRSHQRSEAFEVEDNTATKNLGEEFSKPHSMDKTEEIEEVIWQNPCDGMPPCGGMGRESLGCDI